MRKLLQAGIMALLLAIPVAASAQDANPYRSQGAAVSQTDLARARARGAPINQADLTGNSAAGAITGSNSISSSFQNGAGITSVIQNTGNNSLFQHATTVNVTVR
jgi:hypothetical protein